MIVIHVMGGLGNQLYQYALYEKMKSLGKDVRLDLYAYETQGADREWRPLELDRFPAAEYVRASEADRIRLLDNASGIAAKVHRKIFGRRDKTVSEAREYMPEIFDLEDSYLYGYWNCEQYYTDITALLQKKLQFPQSSNPQNIACMQQMAEENAVSIHIRRTDYLTVADGARYTGICTEAYYQGAMDYIEQRVSNPVYYIFSDDTEYAKAHYHKENMHVVDWNTGEDALFDMQLMSCCRHNICANSTFSMWGARLNRHPDKMMLRPLHHDNYETTSTAQIRQNWKQWILIDEKGKVCE